MEVKLQQGSEVIGRALFEAGVSEVVEADRRSVVKKKRFGLF